MTGFANTAIRGDGLVLGASVGGLTTALRLKQLGVHVVLADSRAERASRPNVVSITPRGLNILEYLGISSVFEGRRAPGSSNGTQASIALDVLINHMRDVATERGIPIHYNTPVVGLVSNGIDGATVALEDGRTAAGRLVFNGTGARSGIEEPLGMELQFAPDWTWYGAARTPYVPERASGVFVRGTIGAEQLSGGFDDRGRATLKYEPYEVPADVEAHRGTAWFGLQNPIDGFSMFTAVGSYHAERLSLEELGQRVLAPARELGEHRVLDAPRLLRLRSAGTRDVWVGSVVALGDSVGRTHAKHMRGTQFALEEGVRAAEAGYEALSNPNGANHAKRAYEAETHARRRMHGWDGSRVSIDPFPGAGDVIDLPMPAA